MDLSFLRGAPAALPRDQLIAPAGKGADDDRLDDAAFGDRGGQLLQRLGIEAPARLFGMRLDCGDGHAGEPVGTAGRHGCVAGPLGLTVIEAAAGILRIAATTMSLAVKTVTTERGLDAASFPLVAYGGAGPLHAVAIAREIGMERVIVPRAPGHFCAFGMLHSDLRYDYVRTWPARLAQLSFADLERIYGELITEGEEALARSGASNAKMKVVRAVDMRYVGQEHAVTIELPEKVLRKQDRAAIKQLFDAEHLLRYGTNAPTEAAELVSLRATISGVMRKPKMEKIARGTAKPPAAALRGTRSVTFGPSASGHGAAKKTTVYARDALKAGNRIAGPALIEEHASTTVVFPSDKLEVDQFGNLVVEIGRA